ncbi:MAG: hypothetical protein ACP5RC_08965 [Halothiobacillaceae bacterium]
MKIQSGEPFLFTHDDWLPVTLTVEFTVAGDGDIGSLDRFEVAARGCGIIPWSYDYDAMEEAWFARLVACNIDPVRSVKTLRGMAKKARDKAEQEYEPVRRMIVAASSKRYLDPQQLALMERCPLDLNAIHPIPANILALGAEHPDAATWLWQNWGTSEGLRHVTLKRPAPGRLVYQFFAANWTPWRAFRHSRTAFPDLTFSLSSKT